MDIQWEELIAEMTRGNARALARLVTHVENREPGWVDAMKQIYGRTRGAGLIGITGPPGAGKSTLTNGLARELVSRGHRVGIIAVDPSSPFSGGSLLGDRIRMRDAAELENVFIRSMATRGALGGLNQAARDVAKIMDASGMDIVLIETVGVGQDEVEVVKTADLVLVVLVPGLGDGIQALKAGIMEIADIYVINKADREGVDALELDILSMLGLAAPGAAEPPPICKTVANAHEGVGQLARRVTGMLDLRIGKTDWQAARIENELIGLIQNQLFTLIARHMEQQNRTAAVVGEIMAGKVDPYTAAETFLKSLLDQLKNGKSAS